MTASSPSGSSIWKIIASIIDGPSEWSRVSLVSLLAVGGTLLKLVISDHVTVVERLEDQLMRRSEAETQIVEAEAKRKQAEAVDAVNRASMSKRNCQIRKLETQRLKLQNDELMAQIDSIRLDAENQQVIANAKVRLLDALSSLRREGGDMFVGEKNLDGLQALIEGVMEPSNE
jgi:hypothetical protein